MSTFQTILLSLYLVPLVFWIVIFFFALVYNKDPYDVQYELQMNSCSFDDITLGDLAKASFLTFVPIVNLVFFVIANIVFFNRNASSVVVFSRNKNKPLDEGMTK